MASAPNPNLAQAQFTSGPSHRQSFCEEQMQFSNSNLTDLALAIKGRHINVSLGNATDFINLDENGTINSVDPGIMIEMLDEVARRGEFTWRDSFIVTQPPSKGKTWMDLLMWEINNYDVAAEWYANTVDRSKMGASFPRGWYDFSAIIIAKKDKDAFGSAFRPFSWSAPFTASVWFSLIVILVVSGLVCYYIEGGDLGTYGVISHGATSHDQSIVSRAISTIYDCFVVFTGHLDIHPTTHAGRVVSLSLSFFTVLMLAAYTANLTSFLVIQNAAFALKIESVGDIVRLSKSICVLNTGAPQAALQSDFSNAIIIEKDNDKDTILGLQNDECDYALIGRSGWEQYERIEATNGKCNLGQIGKVYRNYDGGFATKSDAGTLCTSIVRDVLNIHFQDMHEDGFIKEAWEKHLAKKQDVAEQCEEKILTGTKEDTNTLDMANLGGLFLFHLVFLILALLIWWRIESHKDIKDPVNISSSSYILGSAKSEDSLEDSAHDTQDINRVKVKASKSVKKKNPDIEDCVSRMEETCSRMGELYQMVETFPSQTNEMKDQLSKMEKKFEEQLSKMEGKFEEQLSKVEGKFEEVEEQISKIVSTLSQMNNINLGSLA